MMVFCCNVWYALPYVMHKCCRDGDRASGPDFGRISTSGGRRADLEAFPIGIQPTSGPEDRFPSRKHYCVT